ncbi:MAG: hypothetical protein CM15mP44_5080 [Candidatus Neomarinimicrobiota bacterium]|nr:MAG: hypothetical protein CM15mP44_5080 [Candidatus Neomarinimicrobiota bacterium]
MGISGPFHLSVLLIYLVVIVFSKMNIPSGENITDEIYRFWVSLNPDKKIKISSGNFTGGRRQINLGLE